MKQRLLLIWGLLLLSTVIIQAAPVDASKAKDKALQFVTVRQAAARGKASGNPSLQLASSAAGSYYVFNVGQQNGFVIVSGDDRAPEILGYCDYGTFDEQQIPQNMAAWLQGYADEIAQLDNTEPAAASRSQISLRSEQWDAIEPMLQTTWGQKAPYNNGVSPYVTGCVATAMAQVMYYHRWPTAATTAIPGYSGHGSLPSTILEWSNMKKAYTGAESTAANNAVATLMKYCGYSVEMNYDTGSSSAVAKKAVNAFKTYFGYDENVRYIEREYYSIDEWETIIYEELANGRPVMYGGSTIRGAGHEFICDGYDGNGLFHFNWGWNGDFNGYFVIWSANPKGSGTGGSSTKDGYSVGQSAIIGIQKPTGEQLEEEKKLTAKSIYIDDDGHKVGNTYVYTRSSVANNFPQVPIFFKVGNATSSSFDAYLGLGLYGDNYSKVILNIDGGTCNSGGFYNTGYNIAFGAGLTGSYNIIPISREASSSEWLKDGKSELYYIEATMTETQLTLRVMPIVDLEVTSVEYTGLCMEGLPTEVKVTVRNNGSEYNGNLYLLRNSNTGYSSGEQVALRAGEDTDVFFHYTPNSSGTETYRICTYDGSFHTLTGGTGTQAIAAYSASDNVDLDVTMTIHNTIVGNKILGDKFKATVTATNNTDKVYLGAEIGVQYKYKSEMYISYMENVMLLPGGSISKVLSFDMTYGTSYTINAYQAQNSARVQKGSLYEYTAAEGVEITKADGTTEMAAAEPTMTVPADANSLDLRGNTTVTTLNTTNANPNCLYLLDETATVGGVTKNVIKGTTAENIELTDGADFAAPIDFTSTAISYERTFTQGTDGTGSGWTTIILPFDVQKVMVGTKEIDWFHSSTDTGKNFWLRELVSDSEGAVTFGYVSELKANTPYIIAVPGNKWGSAWDLTNKTIKFVGKAQSQIEKDAETETTKNHYSFIGTTQKQNLNDVYALNATGSKFTRGDAEVLPFRAYFSAISGSRATRLNILSDDNQPTAIALPDKEPLLSGDVYALDGRKVADSIDNLPKGVYIIKGKKIVKDK